MKNLFEHETIQYRGNNYKLRRVDIPGYGERTIATVNLEKSLFAENGEYKDRAAQFLDNIIFFYVETEDLNLPANELSRFVNKQVA